MEPSHTEEPYINVEMYNVAVRLIQEFDELEAKEQRYETMNHVMILNIKRDFLLLLNMYAYLVTK